MTTSIKFVDLLSEVKDYILKTKSHDLQSYMQLHKVILPLRNFDKTKKITLHKRDFYTDKYKYQKIEDDFRVIDNIVIFKDKFITLNALEMRSFMTDIIGIYEIIHNSDPNEDIYNLGCRLFCSPGNLFPSEIDQLYCEVNSN